MRLKDAATFFFALLPCHHSDAQNHRLLNDQHQHGRNHESGEAALRVEHWDKLILNGIGESIRLFLGRANQPLRLDVLVHRQGDLRTRGQHRLVIQQTAHVGI